MLKQNVNLLSAACFLSLTVMTIPNAQADPIPPAVSAPPTPDQAMFFVGPAPGTSFTIVTPTTFNGAFTNAGANIGTLVLQQGTTVNGAVGISDVVPIAAVTLTGNATINGATSASTFNLGQNTLTNVGALNLPSGLVLNTKVVSNALFGNIAAGAHAVGIDGPSVIVNVDASAVVALTPGAPLFIISTSSGTTTGLPVNVTSNSVLYTFTGLNLNGNIEIFPTFIPPANVVTNPVAGAVGSVLPELITIAAANPGSDLATVVNALLALPTAAALTDALLQMSPSSALVGVNRESFYVARQFQRVWWEHLQRNREFCRFNSLDDCCNFPAQECDPCGRVIDPCLNACDNMTIWADGFGIYGHQDPKDHLNGYRAHTWGGMLAVETTLVGYLRAGIGAGYAFTDLDESKFKNNTDINTYQGTLYLTYDTNTWFLDGGFSFGWNRYDGNRHIDFTGVDRTAHAEYDGQEYTGFAAGGYHFYWNCFEITPLASLLYSHLDIEDYTEHGADSIDLHIKEQHYNYLESSLGAKVAYIYKTDCGIFIPEVHSFWIHDFEDEKTNVNATFVGLGSAAGSFKNVGPGIDENMWDIGGGVAFLANDTFTIQVVYDYERSKSYFEHQGMLEMSFDF